MRLGITDEGLNALVCGELKVERNLLDDGPTPSFKVAYDSMVISAQSIKFVYQKKIIAEISLPYANAHDTITVDGLEGKIALSMST